MFGFDPGTLLLIALAMALGGLVKGAIGLGLPIASVAVMSQFLEARLVLALVTAPIVLTNLWQAVQAGHPLEPVKRFWPMILCLILMIWLSAKLVVRLSPEALYGLIGLAVVIFTATSFVRPTRSLPRTAERWAGPLAGSLGGFLGGISTMWGPPMIMYFLMIDLPKEAFIRAIGLVWFVASLPLVLAYLENGILTPERTWMSVLACGPAFLGLLLGQWIRGFIDQETFRKVLLVALFVIGLNLIRRAVL